MTSALTKADLLTLHAICHEAHPEIAHRISVEIAARSSVVEFGVLVFEWRLPLNEKHLITKGKRAGKTLTISVAPRLNEYAQLEPWRSRWRLRLRLARRPHHGRYSEVATRHHAQRKVEADRTRDSILLIEAG